MKYTDQILVINSCQDTDLLIHPCIVLIEKRKKHNIIMSLIMAKKRNRFSFQTLFFFCLNFWYEALSLFPLFMFGNIMSSSLLLLSDCSGLCTHPRSYRGGHNSRILIFCNFVFHQSEIRYTLINYFRFKVSLFNVDLSRSSSSEKLYIVI